MSNEEQIRVIVCYEARGKDRTIEDVDACISSLGNATRLGPSTWLLDAECSLTELISHLANDDKEQSDSFVILSVNIDCWGQLRAESADELLALLGQPAA